MSARRIEGVDVARGLASLIMIQGHAYDGWVTAEGKATAAYAFTRLLGSLPLPAFLVLAGAAVTLRVDAARRRGEDLPAVRRAVMKRGAMIVLYGYLANVAYALMDGWETVDTLLRADVLHVIGLSIVALAWLGIRDDRRSMPRGAAALFVIPTALCPWLSPLGEHVDGPLRFAVGLFVDAPGVTLMPFVPLVAWVALGSLGCAAMLAARRAGGNDAPTRWLAASGKDDSARLGGGTPCPARQSLGRNASAFRPRPGALDTTSRSPIHHTHLRRWLRALPAASERALDAGAPTWFFGGLAAVALAVAIGAHVGTGALVDGLGGALTRAHPAVWLNVVDLGARGLLVLCVGALISQRVGARAKRLLIRLGQGSLVAYVFHIPFCYGRLGEPLRGRLDMAESTAAVVALMGVSVVAVYARDAARAAWRRRAGTVVGGVLR